MTVLITPSDLPTWAPGRMLSASDDLGWTGVGHRAYRYTGLDVPVPPMDHCMIVRYYNPVSSMQRCVDGRWTKAVCVPGDFSLLTHSAQSHWSWNTGIDVSHTYLSEQLLSRVATDVLEQPVSAVQLHDLLCEQDPVVTRIVDAITLEARQHGLGGALYVEALAMQLTVHLLRKYASVTHRRKRHSGQLVPSLLRRLEEYIEVNLHKTITVEQLADIANLGVWTFSRHFSATTGKTPYEFVIERRLERAKKLLEHRTLAIKQIAADCGFSDQAHMTRLFRVRFRTTPARLRRSA